MAKREKACKNCRRLISGTECPACKTSELTKNWKGMAVIIDTDSEIADAIGIDTPGRYAIKIR
ncbi:MAG: transcription elongation factor subunit Spt4 [Candidatus Aenigmatarchaeota archaeon]